MFLFLIVLTFVVDVLEFLSAYFGVLSAYFGSFKERRVLSRMREA